MTASPGYVELDLCPALTPEEFVHDLAQAVAELREKLDGVDPAACDPAWLDLCSTRLRDLSAMARMSPEPRPMLYLAVPRLTQTDDVGKPRSDG